MCMQKPKLSEKEHFQQAHSFVRQKMNHWQRLVLYSNGAWFLVFVSFIIWRHV